MRKINFVGCAAALAIGVGAGGSAPAAVMTTTYAGNGGTGFGGPIGNGTLAVSTDGVGNVTFTLNNAGGFSGNDLVLYLDSVPGGFANTSQFGDGGDGGRQAISAFNPGNPSRDLISFPAGFGADYALEFENDTYDGLFQLAAGGTNSLNYVTGNGPSTAGGPYVVTFPLASLGLATGGSFKFVGDLISTSGYGSNETIGTSVTTPDAGQAPNAGFNGSVTFTAADTFGAVPEPTGVAAAAVAGGAALVRRSRRR